MTEAPEGAYFYDPDLGIEVYPDLEDRRVRVVLLSEKDLCPQDARRVSEALVRAAGLIEGV